MMVDIIITNYNINTTNKLSIYHFCALAKHNRQDNFGNSREATQLQQEHEGMVRAFFLIACTIYHVYKTKRKGCPVTMVDTYYLLMIDISHRISNRLKNASKTVFSNKLASKDSGIPLLCCYLQLCRAVNSLHFYRYC